MNPLHPSKYGPTSHNATDRYQWRAHVNFDTYSVFDLSVVIVELLVSTAYNINKMQFDDTRATLKQLYIHRF